MQSVRQLARRPLRTRSGFTLIELLVVIVVIAILIGLLIPVLSNTFGRVREAEVVTEIGMFDSALVSFKSKHGVEVPSFIVLCETGADWTDDWDATPPVAGITNVHRRASVAFIRQAWPSFDFSIDQDINGNGTPGEVLVLNGSECLLFFLGGVRNPADGPFVGFSANPQNPFDAAAGNRVGPYFQFDVGRLADDDNDDVFEYLDPLPNQQRPYVYVSSYGGRGYQSYGLDNTAATADDELPIPPTGVPIPATAMASIYYTDPDLTSPHNPQTYQLISPGEDSAWGYGGYYDGDAVPPSQDTNRNGMVDPGEDVDGNGIVVEDSRAAEDDNITNFAKGLLN